jgi:hypothetical protein
MSVLGAQNGPVLIEGLHRLDAMKALGESVIDAYLVSARQHLRHELPLIPR